MLKSFCLKALQLIVLTLLLVQIAVGSAFAQEIRSPQETSPQSAESKNKQEEILPARPELTTEEKNPRASSQKQPESVSSPRTSKTDRPVDPYTKYYDSMKKFNEEVYGKDG